LRGLAGAGVAWGLHEVKGLLDRLCRELGEPAPNVEYQAFLDHYPISKYYIDADHNTTPGPKAQRVPRLLLQFDWLIRVHGVPEFGKFLDDRRHEDPQTVLSGVDSVIDVILAARSWKSVRPDRVLVLMGLSGLTWGALGQDEEVRTATVAQLGRLFARVYTVGNDAKFGFHTMPLGLVEHKLRPAAPGGPAAAIAASRLDEVAKPFSVLAAFGVMSENWDTHGGPLTLADLTNASNTSAAILEYGAMPFYGQLPMHFVRRSHQAGQVPKHVSRDAAARWLRKPATWHTGVVVQKFPQRQWWPALARFRFLVSPLGDEIQAPKSVEALLVLTIPITQRGPYRVAHDMQQLGFPMVFVDEWEEVTPGNLSRWWRDLSPRLASFRANCLTTDAYWRMIIGGSRPCH